MFIYLFIADMYLSFLCKHVALIYRINPLLCHTEMHSIWLVSLVCQYLSLKQHLQFIYNLFPNENTLITTEYYVNALLTIFHVCLIVEIGHLPAIFLIIIIMSIGTVM